MDIPTIGRKIWYWPEPMERTLDGTDALDATVCYVHGPDRINIALNSELGNPMGGKESVRLVATPAEAKPGEASWMPYQAKRHAKAIAEESALGGEPVGS